MGNLAELKGRPGRPSLAKFHAETLDRHLDRLRYYAARIGMGLGADLVRAVSKVGKKDHTYIRSQAISFGIMVDKVASAVDGPSMTLSIPGRLVRGLGVAVRTDDPVADIAPTVLPAPPENQ